ncbi:MAG TPA: hypothetical protein VJ749_05535 [Pyrinomonadaceae bacterium]|nr:hypothetical protein [Pyrinomonadaceae bacterium]
MIRRKMSLTGRVLVAALVLVFGAASASAYTIVMRDGRKVEIPDTFTVTNSTLTYEAGDDIQVTIHLNTVDIAATERANGEAKGAFLLRATTPQPAVGSAPPVQRAKAARSITNADLETYRRARIQGEQDYERSRKELGLPSMEERRREAAAIQDRTLEQVRKMREQQELEQEAYWRNRAELFRTAANDGRGPRLGDFPGAFPFDGFSTFPFDGFGFGTGDGGFGRFNRLPVSLFPGFLSTPITPFPSLRPTRRPLLFGTPGTRVIVRPGHRRSR